MSRVAKVGIFGFYSYGNLGDNLMAHIVASEVQANGLEPVIFCKSQIAGMSWKFATSASIEDFIGHVDGVIFGGGGLLISRPQPTDIIADFNRDLAALLASAQRKRIPLYGVSLGGTGAPLDAIQPEARRDLVSSLTYVSLRNREDVPLLEDAQVSGEFLDDIVWTTARKFPVRKKGPNQRPKIGLNLYLGRSRRMKWVMALLRLIVFVRRDLDFVFYEIHPGPNGRFDAFATGLKQPNCRQKVLLEIDAACREIASLDLLITTRLHLGVMAMSFTVPSIAFAGAKKTALLYQRIGRGSYFWERDQASQFAQLFLRKGALRKVLSDKTEIVAADVIESALKNFALIERYCREIEQLYGSELVTAT
jgi:polysaccharide pyruvyl transferase WcaK-like protein